MIVDAIAWHGADPVLVRTLDGHSYAAQLLIRAALFRLLSDSQPEAGDYASLVRALEGGVADV